ncbi:ankyrin repeat-containing protein [Thecaphora frezii]
MAATTPTAALPALTEDQIDDLLFAARVGDLEDVEAFLNPHFAALTDAAQIEQLLLSIKNDSENTLLHYCSANGHQALVDYLLPHSPLRYLLHQNSSGNTALHWAGLNGHLSVVTSLIDRIEACERANPAEADSLNILLHPDPEHRQEQGSERKLWDVRNNAGRGPMSEAQMNEREDVVKYLLECMIQSADDQPAQSNDDQEEQDKEVVEKAEQLNINEP